MEPAETIRTDSEVLSCDGGGGALGHPRVYLNMEGRGGIDCPYCGRRFVLGEGRAPGPNEKAAEGQKGLSQGPGPDLAAGSPGDPTAR